MSHFQVIALPRDHFSSLIGVDDEVLRSHGARRLVVDQSPGYPCRVSLTDASVGETVLLLPFVHHDVDSPYRASGPIFVREQATTARPGVGEMPEMLRRRSLLSVRAYDADAWLVGCEVVPGHELEAIVHKFFADEDVQYLHVHNARPGCYMAQIVRRLG